MNVTAAILPQILSLVPVEPVQKLANAEPSTAKPAQESAKQQPEAAGAQQNTPLPAFDQMAMPSRHAHPIHHHQAPMRKPGFEQRAVRTSGPRQKNLAANSGKSAVADTDLEEAASQLLSVLARDNHAQLESDLEEHYDPLERYQLLEEALSMLGNSSMDEPGKQRLKEQLDTLKADLQSTHGDAIAQGMAATGDMEAALADMEGAGKSEMNAGSPDELRAFYGSKSGGRELSALHSRDMLAKMREAYGDDKVQEALSDLRSKMLGGLSSIDPNDRMARSTGAKLWLSLDDAAAFRAVQSGIAAAHDLRTNLGEFGVLPLLSEAGMADNLMALPEAGKVRAGALVNDMADFKSLRALLRAQTYAAIRRAIADLPLSMWPEEKSARADILAELDNQSIASYIEVPVQPKKEDRREKRLRDELDEEEESKDQGSERMRAARQLMRRRARAESSQ